MADKPGDVERKKAVATPDLKTAKIHMFAIFLSDFERCVRWATRDILKAGVLLDNAVKLQSFAKTMDEMRCEIEALDKIASMVLAKKATDTIYSTAPRPIIDMEDINRMIGLMPIFIVTTPEISTLLRENNYSSWADKLDSAVAQAKEVNDMVKGITAVTTGKSTHHCIECDTLKSVDEGRAPVCPDCHAPMESVEAAKAQRPIILEHDAVVLVDDALVVKSIDGLDMLPEVIKSTGLEAAAGDVGARSHIPFYHLALVPAEKSVQDVMRPDEVAQLVFDRDVIKTKGAAAQWISTNDVGGLEFSPPMTSGEQFFSNREGAPEFIEGTQRTVDLAKGVQAVVARPKPANVTPVDISKLKLMEGEAVEDFREDMRKALRSSGLFGLIVNDYDIGVVKCFDKIVIVYNYHTDLKWQADWKRDAAGAFTFSNVFEVKETYVAKILNVKPDESETETMKAAQAKRAEKYGIEATDGVGESLVYPIGYPTELAKYADPVNLMFPTDTEKRIVESVKQFHADASLLYDKDTSKAVVHERLATAALDADVAFAFDSNDPLDALLSDAMKARLTQPQNVSKRFDAQIIEISKAASGASEECLVTGVVLQPDVTDAQGDIYDEDVIKQAAHDFVASVRKRAQEGQDDIGYMHVDSEKKFALVESYVTPQPLLINGKNVKKGAWVMTVKVLDDSAWAEVKSGQLTGFSILGKAMAVPVAA